MMPADVCSLAARKHPKPAVSVLPPDRAVGPGNECRDDSLVVARASMAEQPREMCESGRAKPRGDSGETIVSALLLALLRLFLRDRFLQGVHDRSEEHTSELQSLMR